MPFPPYLRLYVIVRTGEVRCYTGLSHPLQALVFKGLNSLSIDRSIFELSVYIRLIERPAAPRINASGLIFRWVTLLPLSQLFPPWASGSDEPAWADGGGEVWGAHEFGPNGYGSFDERAIGYVKSRIMRVRAGGGNRTLMGPSGGQFEPRLYRSARGHGGYRMGQAVARNSVVERTWVKDSQHFPAELRDFRVVVEANSHQMHDSVASAERPSPGRPQPGPCPPW